MEDQPGMAPDMLMDTFPVYQKGNNRSRTLWNVNLTATQAEFICPETNSQFTVARALARQEIRFGRTSLLFTEGKEANVNGIIFDFAENKFRLERWFQPWTSREMAANLRSFGIGMVVIGLASVIFSSLLDPVWGIVLIVIGVLNLLVKNRVMFIIDGLAMLGVGVLNILGIILTLVFTPGSFSVASTIWILLGIFQVVWGVQEMGLFGKFAHAAGQSRNK